MKVSLLNLGTVNKNSVTIDRDGRPSLTLYFSYETIVGFRSGGDLVVSENEWSMTTGKLLNELNPNKKSRVPHSEVMERLAKLL